MENASLVGLSRQIALSARAGRRREQHREPEHDRLQGRQRRLPRTPDAGRAREPVSRRRSPASASCRTARPGSISARARCSRPAIRSTSRSSGNAFLTVQTPRGERYTRNGALQINSAGQLVTSEGLRCSAQNGPIVFQPERPRHLDLAPTARSRCARAATPRTRCAASCASRASRSRSGCRRTAPRPTWRRPACRRRMPRRPRASSQGVDREVERARRHRDDAHDRGHAHLHPDRQHAAAAERHAPHGDREARRSPERLKRPSKEIEPCEPSTPPPPA